jgi:hypothetical protein
MCFKPKIPKPPAPPPPVERKNAEDAGDALRRRLAARKGYAASIKTGPQGAADFGRNSQVTSLSSGTGTVTGV